LTKDVEPWTTIVFCNIEKKIAQQQKAGSNEPNVREYANSTLIG